MNLRRILSQTALIIGALIFSIGLQAYAQTFVQPSTGPTGGNAQAPLDTGPNPNIKQGGLVVGAGSGFTTGLLVENGNVGIGTMSPAGKLDVEGGNLCLNGSCIGSWPTGIVSKTVVYLCPFATVPSGSFGVDYSGRCGSTTCVNQNVDNLSTQSTCSIASTLIDGACAPQQTRQCNFIGNLTQ